MKYADGSTLAWQQTFTVEVKALGIRVPGYRSAAAAQQAASLMMTRGQKATRRGKVTRFAVDGPWLLADGRWESTWRPVQV
jgi:hypothetical protein